MRLANSTVIKSIVLINETVKRVRLVQSCLGYNILLPYPEGGCGYTVEEDEVDISGWTKAKALQRLMDETKQLVDEFSGRGDNFEFEDVRDNTVLVDSEHAL